jgi:hypothetical protein
MDVRCEHKKHGEVVDEGFIEIKCDSRFCGAGPGIVVLHQFDTSTGALVKTMKFKNPKKEVK